MIVGHGDDPKITSEIAATVCWMSDTPLKKGAKYLLKHNCRTTKAVVSNIDHLIDVNTLKTDSGERPFEKNAIGRIQIKTYQDLVCDAYRSNRETGAFILIDPSNHDTLACGMIDLPRDGFAPTFRSSNDGTSGLELPSARLKDLRADAGVSCAEQC